MSNMNWKDIIKKEYEIVTIQKEKQISEYWKINKVLVRNQNNSKESPCAVWKVGNDNCSKLCRGNMQSVIYYREGKETVKKMPSFILPAVTPPPPMTMWTPIPRNFVSKDSEELQSIPYLDGDVIDDCFIAELLSCYNGNWAGAKIEAIDDDIFVNLVRALIPYQLESSTSSQASCNNVNQKTADKPSPDPMIFQSISSYFDGNFSADKYVQLTKHNFKFTSYTPNIDEPLQMRECLQPDQSMHSYRKMFCRRCFIYNCQLHPDHENDIPKSSSQKRNFKELESFIEPCCNTCYLVMDDKKQDKENILAAVVSENSSAFSFTGAIESENKSAAAGSGNTIDNTLTHHCCTDAIITEINKENILAAVLSKNTIGETHAENCADAKNKEDIPAAAVSESSSAIESEIKSPARFENTIDNTLAHDCSDAKNSENEWNFSDQSMMLTLLKVFPNNCCAIAKILQKSCDQVYRQIQSIDFKSDREHVIEKENCRKDRQKKSNANISKKHLKATYTPCNHQESCYKNLNCLCLNCEKFCNCNDDCTKRVAKCSCKGSCRKKCICYDGHRECDPETCTCVCCDNIGISRGVEKKLRIIASQIHGWGVAIKEPCQKFDFITEYKGEIISLNESERRGKVYDKNNHTYMFTLNDETVIDSMRFGSKFRFANYPDKKNPNCVARVMMVNGDHRIGIYALRYIENGEELTIDYNTHDPTVPKNN